MATKTDAKKSTGPKKSKGLRVNFTGVETRVLLPEGLYHSVVDNVEVEEGNAAPYLKWTFKTKDEDSKLDGKPLYYNTSLAPQALWNLRNLLETLGVETPDSEVDLVPSEWHGLELMLKVQHEEWEGKTRAKVTDFQPLEEVASTTDDETPAAEEPEGEAAEEADDEEPAEEEVAAEETDDGKISEDEVREMDDKEHADLVKTHKLKVDLKKVPPGRKRISAIVDALEAAGLLRE